MRREQRGGFVLAGIKLSLPSKKYVFPFPLPFLTSLSPLYHHIPGSLPVRSIVVSLSSPFLSPFLSSLPIFFCFLCLFFSRSSCSLALPYLALLSSFLHLLFISPSFLNLPSSVYTFPCPASSVISLASHPLYLPVFSPSLSPSMSVFSPS